MFCKVDFASLLAVEGNKLFGCFDGNLGNTGQMEMFSMPGLSDLVKLAEDELRYRDEHVYLILITGVPVVAQSLNAFVFFVVFYFSSATKWKNCAIVPSGHWALNTMTTNCDPRRVKVFTCITLMMIDFVTHGQGRVTDEPRDFCL